MDITCARKMFLKEKAQEIDYFISDAICLF